MVKVKDLVVKLITKPKADAIIKKYHYSGKVTQNSQINFGVFANGFLVGAVQYGPSIDKKRMAQSLGVDGYNKIIELNRVAISDICPKNTESRVLAFTIRFIKSNYPHIKIIVSFADGCQCGDGAIYRATGFKLHSYKKNKSLVRLGVEARQFIKKYIPNVSDIVSRKTLDDFRTENGKYLSSVLKNYNSTTLSGYQFKYLYIIDKEILKDHKFVSFQDIPIEAMMYKGKKARVA